MLSTFHLWWSSVNGPTIYRVPPMDESSDGQSLAYQSNTLEAISSNILRMTSVFYGFLKWTVLFWTPWILKSAHNPHQLVYYAKCATYLAAFYATTVIIRGTGRVFNPSYRKFIEVYQLAEKYGSDDALNELLTYSFSSVWPAQFDIRSLSASEKRLTSPTPPRSPGVSLLLWPLTWTLAHTVGIRLTYPGCTGFLNSMTLPHRLHARDELQRRYALRRVGLITEDGDFVEAMYSDRRGSDILSNGTKSPGNILIICCEGNGGYPEIGTPVVPLRLGYSILAWNHPGFGSSTSLPFPNKEQNAVETVLMFALHRLRFPSKDVYLFGWSIGGYTASWIAMNYPEIGGVILDATFDDVELLARRLVPDIFCPLVVATLRSHLDLNNLAHLKAYDGPVRIIRRSQDEIISTDDPPSHESNRGTHLLIALLKHRFPHLFTPNTEGLLREYLSLDSTAYDDFLHRIRCNPDEHGPAVIDFLSQELELKRMACTGSSTPLRTVRLFPSNLGHQISDESIKCGMLLYLVSQYFVEAPGSHCAPLEPGCFRTPWTITTSTTNFDITRCADSNPGPRIIE
ncbi:unnamed protein product [Dicrocoelium dendriticum]|nr:unnamed protein product [Dicrocoelium dendriticum]